LAREPADLTEMSYEGYKGVENKLNLDLNRYSKNSKYHFLVNLKSNCMVKSNKNTTNSAFKRALMNLRPVEDCETSEDLSLIGKKVHTVNFKHSLVRKNKKSMRSYTP